MEFAIALCKVQRPRSALHLAMSYHHVTTTNCKLYCVSNEQTISTKRDMNNDFQFGIGVNQVEIYRSNAITKIEKKSRTVFNGNFESKCITRQQLKNETQRSHRSMCSSSSRGV